MGCIIILTVLSNFQDCEEVHKRTVKGSVTGLASTITLLVIYQLTSYQRSVHNSPCCEINGLQFWDSCSAIVYFCGTRYACGAKLCKYKWSSFHARRHLVLLYSSTICAVYCGELVFIWCGQSAWYRKCAVYR